VTASATTRGRTAKLRRAAGVDYFGTFGSGGPTAAIPSAHRFDERDIAHAFVGSVREDETPVLELGGEQFTSLVRADVYTPWN
jgi:hypothetical protein